MEQMNALKIIQHLRNIKLRELYYIYLWEPSENLYILQRVRSENVLYTNIYNTYFIMNIIKNVQNMFMIVIKTTGTKEGKVFYSMRYAGFYYYFIPYQWS